MAYADALPLNMNTSTSAQVEYGCGGSGCLCAASRSRRRLRLRLRKAEAREPHLPHLPISSRRYVSVSRQRRGDGRSVPRDRATSPSSQGEGHTTDKCVFRERVRAVASDDTKKGKGTHLQKPDCAQRSWLAGPIVLRLSAACGRAVGGLPPKAVRVHQDHGRQEAWCGAGHRGNTRKAPGAGALSWPK